MNCPNTACDFDAIIVDGVRRYRADDVDAKIKELHDSIVLWSTTAMDLRDEREVVAGIMDNITDSLNTIATDVRAMKNDL